MPDMPKDGYRYLYKQTSRHGRTVWYVRRRGQPKIRLRAAYDTPEFWAEYSAAIAGAAKEGQKRALAASRGTLGWLWQRYRESAAWAGLSTSTRRQRENIMGHVLERSGTVPFALITPAEIEEGKDRRRDTPSQARNFLDVMRGLFRWAKRNGHVTVDPTAGIDNPPRPRGQGFAAWTLDDVAAYERRWPKGTREWIWLRVLLYTGLRRGDAVRLGRQHIRDGLLSFRTEKTGSEIYCMIAPELAEALRAPAAGEMTIIVNEHGRPFVKESFGNVFSAAARAAGIKKSAHGLRKLAATLWAERGASEPELEAMFGWARGSMAALYTKDARRKALAIEAARRLGTSADRECDPPIMRCDPPGRKAE